MLDSFFGSEGCRFESCRARHAAEFAERTRCVAALQRADHREALLQERQEENVQKMNAPLPFCVYVLQSAKDGGLYVGFTTDLLRRLGEHNSGTSVATACRRPFELVFCEYYRSKRDAQRREVYLKTSAGRRALKLMLQESLPHPPPSSLSG